MNIFLPLKLAWRSLFVHKGRTFLTILGIMIGIGAVIIVMSAGESIKELVLSEFDSYGADFVQIEIKVPSTAKNSTANATALASGIEVTTLTLEDADAIGRISNIGQYGSGIMGQSVVTYLNENKTVNFLGASENILPLMGVEIGQGRSFTTIEDDDLSKVVVLGSDVASNLFGNQDPIGKNIRIGRLRFKVIGVTKERGATFGFNFDEMVYLPLQTTQKLIMGVDYVVFITAKMIDVEKQDETADEIIAVLRNRHEIDDPKDDDFAVTTAEEALSVVATVFDGITLLLVAIAGISLLVGGIGIMNIMYVSVTERTFEIGLRKAIGANPRQILWQFLWEAIVVTVFGGIIGIIGGASITFLVSLVAGQLGYNWAFVLPPESIVIAFCFCAAVGLIFGFYPARRAARMDPINALRHE